MNLQRSKGSRHLLGAQSITTPSSRSVSSKVTSKPVTASQRQTTRSVLNSIKKFFQKLFNIQPKSTPSTPTSQLSTPSKTSVESTHSTHSETHSIIEKTIDGVGEVAEGLFEVAHSTELISEGIISAAEVAESAAEATEKVSEASEKISEATEKLTETLESLEPVTAGVTIGAGVLSSATNIYKSVNQIKEDSSYYKEINSNITSLSNKKSALEKTLALQQEKNMADADMNHTQSQLSAIKTQLTALKSQRTSQILNTFEVHGKTATSLAQTGLTIAQTSSTVVSGATSGAVPLAGLVWNGIKAPFDIAKLAQSSATLNNVKTTACPTLESLDSFDNTASLTSTSSSTKTQSTKTTSNRNLFKTIKNNIQKKANKNVQQKALVTATTLIGIGAGVATIVALSNPVGWALIGAAAVVGIGTAIYTAVQNGRHNKKVSTHTSVTTMMQLANQTRINAKKAPYSFESIMTMTSSQLNDVAKEVATALKSARPGSASITRHTGGVFPKFPKIDISSFDSAKLHTQLNEMVSDLRHRSEISLDVQIKTLYNQIQELDGAKKEKCMNELHTFLSKTSLKSSNDEVKMWLEGGFKDYSIYKSPVNQALSV